MSHPPADGVADRSAEIIARDRAGVVGSATLAVAGQAGAFAAGLAAMIVTTRLLGPEGYGRLSLFFLLLAILSQALVSWPNLGLVRFGREELARTGGVGETFAAASLLFLGNLAAAGILVFAFRKPLSDYLGIGPGPHALLLAYVALNEAVFFCRAVFQTAGRFRLYAAATFGVRFLNLLFILLAFVLLARPATARGIIGAHLASLCVVATACALAAAFLPEMSRGRLRFDLLKRVASYSWPLMMGGLWALVVDWIDLAVIKHFRPPEEVGWYAVAYQPVTVITQLGGAFIGALLPLLVSLALGQRHGSIAWALDEMSPQLCWAVGGALTLAAGAAEAIPWALGARYAESVLPCQVLMAGTAFSLPAAFHAAVARAVDRVGVSVAALTALAATNIALDLLWVPRAGMMGAAWATTVAFAVSGLVYFPFFHRLPALRGAAPGRRYAMLLGLLPPLAFAAAACRLAQPLLRLGACAGLLSLAVLAARQLRVFRRSTLDELDGVAMPGLARACARRFYSLMDPRP